MGEPKVCTSCKEETATPKLFFKDERYAWTCRCGFDNWFFYSEGDNV